MNCSILKVFSCCLCVPVIVNAVLGVNICNLLLINFSSLCSVYDCFHFGNWHNVSQSNLIYTYCYCEKITKVKIIFENIEDFPYICHKRKKKHYDTRIWSEELLLHQKRAEN